MKKLGLLLVVAISIFSCKNAEQHKAGIEELGTNWDATTAAFTEFAGTVEAENTTFTETTAAMAVDSAALAKLPADAQTKINDAKAVVTNAGAGYASLLTEISTFGADWTAKAAEVTALKEGLAAGKLEGDAAAKIAELTTYVTDSQAKVATMKETFKSVKEASTNGQVEYTKVLEMNKLMKK